MDLSPGCWLGDWSLEAPLGQGGFGRVYRARHGETGAVAAVKVAREPRDLRPIALEHPGVVRTLEARLDHDPPFVALELVPDGNLREALRGGPLPAARAVEVITQVAAALDHAHARGVLHLDVKPENVLVDEAARRYKLTDFGGPRVDGDAQEVAHSLRLTGDVRLAATRDYAAPELREGSSRDAGERPPGAQELPGRIDRRADVYSLGVLAFELLTGRLPLGLDRPSELAPTLPRAVDAALERALARAADRRTPSAGELARELALAFAPRPAATAPAAERRRGSWLPTALIVGVAALVGGVLFQRLRPASSWSARSRPAPFEARLAPLLRELPAGARALVLPPLDLDRRGDGPRGQAARRALEDAVARAGRAPSGDSAPGPVDLAALFDRGARADLQRRAGAEAAVHAVLAGGERDWLTLIDLPSWSVLAATGPHDEALADLGRRLALFLLQQGELRPLALLPVTDAARGVSNRTTAELDADLLAAVVAAGQGRLAVRARPGIVERLRDSGGEVRRALSVGLALEGRVDAAAGRLEVALRDLETGATRWTGAAAVAGLGGYDVGLDMDRFTGSPAAVDRVLAERLDRLIDAQVDARVAQAVEAAREHLRAARPDDAVALLEGLRARGRPYAAQLEPLLLLARAHEARGDLPAALTTLEDALAAAPGSARAVDELARLTVVRARALFKAGKRAWWRDDDEALFEEAARLLRRLDGLELAAERRAERDALRERLEDEL